MLMCVMISCVFFMGLSTVYGQVCPEGWNDHGLSCYKLIDIRYTFQEAQTACEQEDAYVVVAHDDAENAFVDEIALDGDVWLGCTARGGNHLWTCPDGSGKTYDANSRTASPEDSYWYWDWDSGQPQINGEECQVQRHRSGLWHDYGCSSTFPVVCKRPATGYSPCPLGWQMFKDNCYFLNHAARVDYAQASIACTSMGARLVSIHSMEQQGFLVDRLQDDTDRDQHYYYIGLDDKAEENTFVWSDGSPLDFEDWKSNEPNDYGDGEDCGSLWPRQSGTWNDIPCNTDHAYICKRGKEPHIITTIETTTEIPTSEGVSKALPSTQMSDISATMTNTKVWTSHGSTDSRSSLSNSKSSASTATGVSIASVFLLLIISCVVVLVVVKRRKKQEHRKSQNVIQLDGPYGDITNIIRHQHTKDTNTYEGVDHTNIRASQRTGVEHVEGHGELDQNVPVDRSGQERESSEETYQDFRDEESCRPEDNGELYENVPAADGPSQVQESADDTYQDVRDDQASKQLDGKTDEELYQDIRDIDEHDYVAVDADKTKELVDKADGGLIEIYARSQYGGAPCSKNDNQLEGWVENDIYAKSVEEQPERQNGEDNKTEGWVDNDIYARSN